MRSRTVLLALVCLGGGCGSAESGLIVDLRTDYRPGVEFVGVELDLNGVESGSEVVSTLDNTLDGIRIGEYALPAGSHEVTVRLVTADGRSIAARTLVVLVRGLTGATVVITRSCRGIVCPSPEAPELTGCLDGVCVDPRCTPETPATCPAGTCTTEDECPAAPSSCTSFVCRVGSCLLRADEGRCAVGETCDLDLGCVGGMESDAGVTDAGPAFTYEWITGDTCGGCSERCGGGTCPLEVTCRRSDGMVVDDALCDSPRPTPTRACNTQPCCTTDALDMSDRACEGATSDIIRWVQFHFGRDDGSSANRAECQAQCTSWAESAGVTRWCCDLTEDSTPGQSWSCALHSTVGTRSRPAGGDIRGSYAGFGQCL